MERKEKEWEGGERKKNETRRTSREYGEREREKLFFSRGGAV